MIPGNLTEDLFRVTSRSRNSIPLRARSCIEDTVTKPFVLGKYCVRKYARACDAIKQYRLTA